MSGIAAWLSADGYDVDPFFAIYPEGCNSPGCDAAYWLTVAEARAVVVFEPADPLPPALVAGLLEDFVFNGGALLVAASDPQTIA